MFGGKKLVITAKGLIGGLTETHDGIAFFGSSDKKDVKFKNLFNIFTLFRENISMTLFLIWI